MTIGEAEIDRIVDLLSGARSVLFITGAGISADSGMPTYRGVGGLYDVDDTEDGVPIEVALSGEMFRSRPELTWKYLVQIAAACRGRSHNRGHEVIAEFERRFDRVWTLTQNVDGFHTAAGAENVIEIHGNLSSLKCTSCSWSETVTTDDEPDELPPRCPSCDAVIRPDVVLFNEMLPAGAVNRLQHELEQGFDLVFSVGTSSVFPYIIEPVLAAVRSGGAAIEINPARTAVSDIVTVRIEGGAAETLDAIWSRL